MATDSRVRSQRSSATPTATEYIAVKQVQQLGASETDAEHRETTFVSVRGQSAKVNVARERERGIRARIRKMLGD